MIDPTIAEAVAQIHDAPLQASVAVTGAGSSALAWLLAVPGGSRTLLEAHVPYSRPALQTYLGFEPEQYASGSTALALAARAYARGQGYQERPGPLVGLACAAAIATVPARRGSHRAAVATWGDSGYTVYELTLAKGRRDRYGEELLVSGLVLRALAEAAGLPGEELCRPDEDEELIRRRVDLRGRLEALLRGELPLLRLMPDGALETSGAGCGLILPGSFNPLHYGHRELAATASEETGGQVCFEIAARNADKPALDADTLLARLRQFAGYAPIAVTAAPLFVEKARLFPNTAFVIGADTAARLVEPRYYGGEAAMQRAFAEMRRHGARFLVAGRAAGERFVTLADIALPPEARDLFASIPPERFRADISSTALRAVGQTA